MEVPNPLADSVDRLAGEVRVLRNVLDEIREEFSGVTQNGLPVKPVEYACVKRMALDPCAEDWGEKLEIVRSVYDSRTGSPLGLRSLDRVAEELERTLEAVAEGQLEVVLTALDGVRAELLKAIRGAGKSDGWEPREVRRGHDTASMEATAVPPLHGTLTPGVAW